MASNRTQHPIWGTLPARALRSIATSSRRLENAPAAGGTAESLHPESEAGCLVLYIVQG